jgi:hypothetical protein
MVEQAVLLLTLWLSDGSVTARAVLAPSYADCIKDGPRIAASIQGQSLVVEGRPVRIVKVDGYCHDAGGRDA